VPRAPARVRRAVISACCRRRTFVPGVGEAQFAKWSGEFSDPVRVIIRDFWKA
jgi:hypothetical protein